MSPRKNVLTSYVFYLDLGKRAFSVSVLMHIYHFVNIILWKLQLSANARNLKQIIQICFLSSLFEKKYPNTNSNFVELIYSQNTFITSISIHSCNASVLATSGHMITLYTTTTFTTALVALQTVCITITLCNRYIMCTLHSK